MRTVVTTLVVIVAGAAAAAQEKNPVELGGVGWERDLDRGLAAAKEKECDLFVLFQEVPG